MNATFVQRGWMNAPFMQANAGRHGQRDPRERSSVVVMHSALKIHPDVAQALAEGRPVVALESTIISHGLPRPANLETALRIEETVRRAGAVPATIAVALDPPFHLSG